MIEWELKRNWPKALFVIGSTLGVAFVVHLAFLFAQLDNAFVTKTDFVPTQIYSDVSHIRPSQSRPSVMSRLKKLGYTPYVIGNKVTFTLHPISYPDYLLPEGHPTFQVQGEPLELLFEGQSKREILTEIRSGNTKLPDLYLEPQLLATLSGSDSSDSIRKFTSIEDIPPLVYKSVIGVEDHNYLEHSGFDPRGILRAVWVNLKTLSFSQGGSTLTQQLVKNLMARRTKNLYKKLTELFLSLLLELKYEKKQILERYLNEVYLGQVGNLEIHGVAQGSRHFFDRPLSELNTAEIALLAGLIRGPNYYSPYRHFDRAINRQRTVLQRMLEVDLISEDEAEEALQMPVRIAPPKKGTNRAPYFVDYVKAKLIEKLSDRLSESEISIAGFKIYTTLDLTLNDIAQDAVREIVKQIEASAAAPLPEGVSLEGAMAVADHKTGKIRALIGGKDYSISAFNRALNSKRQVGSTFKPIVYLSAFEEQRDPKTGRPYGPAAPIEDAPWKLTYNNGTLTWTPENYDREYLGWIPMRKALINSINIPAAKIGAHLGPKRLIQTARRLGISSSLPEVPSIALGTAELTITELLEAYGTLANHGTRNDVFSIRGITQADGTKIARFVYYPEEAIDPTLADLMRNLMQDVFTEGTARRSSSLGFHYPAAGKTGTTSDYRDSWFAGFTPMLTAVVWIGLDQGTSRDDKGRTTLKLTGAGTALPVWIEFMKKALDDFPPQNFPENDELEEVMIDSRTGFRAKAFCSDEQIWTAVYSSDLVPSGTSCEESWPDSITEESL